jgi:hypothetical protein
VRRAARSGVGLALAALAFTSPAVTAGGQTGIRLVNVTTAVNLDHKRTGTWSNVWADHDANGWPDLFIGRHGGKPLFFSNREGVYRRLWMDFVTPPGYDSIDGDETVDRHNCAWGEATGDGRPDLYCTVGANLGTSVGPNQLLVRTRAGVRDIARRYRVRDIYGRGRSVNWIDHDSDGDLDIFVGNWERSGYPSGLFENRRGTFHRVSVGLEDHLRTIGSTWSDWDSDGDPDLLVTQFTAPTVAYENRGGRFEEIELPNITEGEWHAAAWGDFDGNGYSDLHLLNESRSLILRNTRAGFEVEDSRSVAQGRASAWLDIENDGDLDLFVVAGAGGGDATDAALNQPDMMLIRRADAFVRMRRASFAGPEVGNGDSATVADHDRDGRQDVVVTNGYHEYDQWQGRVQLFANRSEAMNWIALDLVGTRWNPWGMGARVTVTMGAISYRRELTDGVAFRSQSEVAHVHLGLGSEAAAEVRIDWPGGPSDCLIVPSGTRLRVERGSTPCL